MPRTGRPRTILDPVHEPRLNKGCPCAHCKERNSATRRRHYEGHRDAAREYNRTVQRAGRAFVNAAKAIPCTDCGVQYPACVMQFDHLRDKKFNVAAANRSLATLAAEIAKCEVVCANCHALRTDARRKAARA